LVQKARELRQAQTPAEEVLWQLLRNRQLAGLKFRRQHQIGDYITDFYCDERKLVVELDGEVHDTPHKAKADSKRQKYLESIGLTVLRFRNQTVLESPQSVIEKIAATNLPPSPPGRGAGGEGRALALNTKDHVLMIDARAVGQLMKGSRKVYEFTPEQMRSLTAIVWLYRGQGDRFLALVLDYFQKHAAECAAVPEKLTAYDSALAALDAPFAALAKAVKSTPDLDVEKTKTLADTLAELRDARKACAADAKSLLADLAACVKKLEKSPPATNAAQHKARQDFDPVAERAKGLVKQVDLLYKLASRVAATGADLASNEEIAEAYDRRPTGRLIKQLDEARRAAVEQLKHATYFHHHIVWLQDRFPKAEMQPVPGLCKVVTRKEIAAADWSLTPGRYVGVAAAEVDEDFDFEQTITEIHEELAGLNAEAVELAAAIQTNLEELGV
jgi:type I restriction enzyme M protein